MGTHRRRIPKKKPKRKRSGAPYPFEFRLKVVKLYLEDEYCATLIAEQFGTILDNFACLQAEGRIWCDVQQLGGGPRGYVAAAFLKPAVSPDRSVATGPDDSALRAGQGKFDATGKIPCSKFVGQPMMPCSFGMVCAGGGYATIVIQ
jgi:hypothetical protein